MLRLINKFYNWIIALGHSIYGYTSLFIFSLSESIFFPIPPDVLLIAFSLGNRKKAFNFAFVCSLGSIIGGMLGYFIGYYLWWDNESYSKIANIFFNNVPGFNNNLFNQIQTQYNKYDFIIIFTAGFTPIPYKIFSISAGAFKISLPLFLLTSMKLN